LNLVQADAFERKTGQPALLPNDAYGRKATSDVGKNSDSLAQSSASHQILSKQPTAAIKLPGYAHECSEGSRREATV
jgi:hypothetical protein